MSDTNSTTIIEPFPSKIRFLFWLSYPLPVIMYCIMLVFSGEFKAAELEHVLLSPLMICAVLIVDIILPQLVYNFYTKRIREYDGSDESIRLTNRRIIHFEKIHLALILANIVISIIFPLMECDLLDIKVDVLALGACAIGCDLLFGFLPYILFTQAFERPLWPIPFNRDEMSSSFVNQSVMILFFCLFGLAAFTLAPVFVLENEKVDSLELFMSKILPCAVVGVAMAIFDASLLQYTIQKRLGPLTDFAYTVSKRDYTAEVIKIRGRNEIGMVLQSLNEFYKVTSDLLMAMEDSIEISKKSGETLATGMTETASAITQITANIDSVKTRIVNQSAGVEQADATIDGMVEKMNMLVESVNRQSDDISTSSTAIEEMVANIRSVSDILAKNSVAVNQLTSASDTGRAKVEQAVEQAKSILEESAGLLEASDIIQNIAEQTNLLAMNAAIEAAHAGEAGKGFAVVSDEIRKLAEQSNTQGKTISVQLEKLQQSIANITTATKEVQDQFSIIFNLADTVKNQETVVEHAMQEQNAGSAQVLDAIKSMKQSTQVIQNGSMEIQSGSKEIAAEMKSLSQVTEEINGAMNEISNGTESIMVSVNEVNESTEKNIENLNLLTDEMSRFKIKKAQKN